MDVITRNCPRCSAPLEIGPEQTWLECPYCGCTAEVVRRSGQRVELTEQAPPNPPRAVPCPAGLQIEERGTGLHIWWRWFHPMLIFLGFFCLAWNAFLLVWYGIAVGIGGMAPWPVRVLMFVFPLAHVAVGVGLSYFTLAGLLNRTRITVEAGTLSVRHGPIPWKQPPTLFVDDVEDFYVTRGGEQSDGKSGAGYGLHAIDRDGGRVDLIRRLTDGEIALCVAERLRRQLKLEHRPVPGEYTG